jgi:hypothetical protein
MPVSSGSRGDSRGHLAAVFLIAFSVVTYEIALTRVFAVVLAHHYVFLAISVAICGLGLGGLFWHRMRSRGMASEDALARSASGFAVSGAACLIVLVRWLFPFHIARYWLAGVLLLVPFGCAGAFLAGVFERYGSRAGRFYGADLAGSGLAAASTVLLLHGVGGTRAALLAMQVASLAALWCAHTSRERRIALLGGASIALVFVLDLAAGLLAVQPIRGGLRADGEYVAKPLFVDLARPAGERPILREVRWNAFARTDLVENPGFGAFYRDAIYQVFTNGHVPTYMMRVDADLRSAPLEQALQAIPAYEHIAYTSRLAFQLRSCESVLCIGPGGGSDVLLALKSGARSVEGAELNPSILALMRKHAEFNGHLYERDDVSIATAEGRAYVRASDRRYDLIYSALTQTATSSGANAMLESYIYTIEAFRDYWSHLADEGVLAFVVHEPWLAWRLFSTGAALLAERGIAAQAAVDHMAILTREDSPYKYLFLLSRTPIAADEAERLARQARDSGVSLVHLPQVEAGFVAPLKSGAADMAQLLDRIRFVDEATGETKPFELSPTTDDRPFFFDVMRARPEGLLELGCGALVLVLVFSVWARLGRRGAEASFSLWPFLAHFSALGAGFLLIEIPLIQRLALALGYPTLALSVTLFALLLGGGAGSFLSQRSESPRAIARTIQLASLGAVLLAVAYVLVLPRVELFLLQQNLALRAGAATLALFALGFLLGMPFPCGVRLLARRSPSDVPWMWGVNGILSVVGSLLAASLAGSIGFRGVLLCGAAVYFGVALLAPRLARAVS